MVKIVKIRCIINDDEVKMFRIIFLGCAVDECR